MTLLLIFRVGTLLALFVEPQYLARLQDYRIEQLGNIMLVMAVATLFMAPIAYWLVSRIDARIVLSAGLGAMALSAVLCAQITAEWASDQFALPLIFAGAGQALTLVAILRYAVFGANPLTGPSHGVLFNAAGSLGLVIGVALVSHAVVEREKFHSARLSEAVTSLEPATSARLVAGARSLGPWLSDAAGAQRGALAGIARSTAEQAFSLAFQDTFLITASVLAAGAVLAWVLPRLPGKGAQ